MTGKLSERFAALKPATAGNNADRNRGGRVQQRATQQKDKRAAQTQARRGVPANNKANNNADKKNNNKPAGKGGRLNKPKIAGKRPNSKGGKRPNNKGKKENTPAPTAEDLDKEMASYWHKAGKGPDPDLMALDDELEEYNKAKDAAKTESNQ